MHIRNIGTNHWHDPEFSVNRPSGSGDYLLLLIHSSAVFTFGNSEKEVGEGTVILFIKWTPQIYRADGARFGNDWLHFLPDSDEDEKFLSDIGIPFDTPLMPGSLSELRRTVNMICREFYSRDTFRCESMDLLLKLLFFKLNEKLHRSSEGITGTNYERMSLLRTKIYNDPAQDWNIEGLSRELAMSASSFQHTYKKLFGVTPMNDVISARIERAKYLLSTTDSSIKQIAHICGYSSDMHFVRQFGKVMGKRPTEYRRETSELFDR